MIASATLSPALQRACSVLYLALRKFLMLAGLIFIIALIGQQSGRFNLLDSFMGLVPSSEAAVAVEEELADLAAEPSLGSLSPRMRGALDYVSKRYRVADEALLPIFSTAQATARELHLDPLLIIAVIGVESGFNPFSQSVVGAQGLMQVIPRFHLDKLPEEMPSASFLDPVTNVQVGARVLKESIRRNGGLEEGLQQFGGAVSDPERRYAGKVLAEKQRLEQAALRLRTTT